MASDETLQRLRRIETRVTEVAIAMGVGQGAQKPEYRSGYPGKIILPSPHASIASILEALPDRSVGEVDVFVGETYLTTLRVS